MSSTQKQNPDGSWSDAEPIPFLGWKANIEARLRRRGFHRLAILMGRWDERGLGK